ncbi:MAG TPA: hypothetical protein VKT80_08515 [Chloroflexota bacterium]|nr:hypothetical protein [Chloroflexota bacterium]
MSIDQVYFPLTEETWPEVKRQLNRARLDLWLTRQPGTLTGLPRLAASWIPSATVPSEIQILMVIQRKLEFLTV